MTIARQQFGLHGEDLAVRALERAGYAILARRYRVRAGEIDIVALDGRCLVFVEVKSRQNGRFGGAAVDLFSSTGAKVVDFAQYPGALPNADSYVKLIDVLVNRLAAAMK